MRSNRQWVWGELLGQRLTAAAWLVSIRLRFGLLTPWISLQILLLNASWFIQLIYIEIIYGLFVRVKILKFIMILIEFKFRQK